jgi:hypothetical protein
VHGKEHEEQQALQSGEGVLDVDGVEVLQCGKTVPLGGEADSVSLGEDHGPEGEDHEDAEFVGTVCVGGGGAGEHFCKRWLV